MVTRVPPATGPYNGHTLSTDVDPCVTVHMQSTESYTFRKHEKDAKTENVYRCLNKRLYNKRLSYSKGTARRALRVEILSTAAAQLLKNPISQVLQ